jgi:hypothetical protein
MAKTRGTGLFMALADIDRHDVGSPGVCRRLDPT